MYRITELLLKLSTVCNLKRLILLSNISGVLNWISLAVFGLNCVMIVTRVLQVLSQSMYISKYLIDFDNTRCPKTSSLI